MRARHQPDAPPSARVTVVVITRNRANELARALHDLAELPERPPVIVIDNGSTDHTRDVVRSHPVGATLIALDTNRGASSRNLGVERATTPYIAFCDDDMSWQPGSLAQAAELLDRHPRLALLNARILVEPGQRLDPGCIDMEQSPLPAETDLPGRPVLGFMAGGTIVRREAFLSVGGFEHRFQVGGEEKLMAVDLVARGWQLAYTPELVAFHRPSPARDPSSRARIVARNHLWFTWLRRPLPVVIRETVRVAQRALSEPAARAALREALAELEWVRRQRAVLPARVEAGLRLLEQANGGTPR